MWKLERHWNGTRVQRIARSSNYSHRGGVLRSMGNQLSSIDKSPWSAGHRWPPRTSGTLRCAISSNWRCFAYSYQQILANLTSSLSSVASVLAQLWSFWREEESWNELRSDQCKDAPSRWTSCSSGKRFSWLSSQDRGTFRRLGSRKQPLQGVYQALGWYYLRRLRAKMVSASRCNQ